MWPGGVGGEGGRGGCGQGECSAPPDKELEPSVHCHMIKSWFCLPVHNTCK